jgi:hypothetical protein
MSESKNPTRAVPRVRPINRFLKKGALTFGACLALADEVFAQPAVVLPGHKPFRRYKQPLPANRQRTGLGRHRCGRPHVRFWGGRGRANLGRRDLRRGHGRGSSELHVLALSLIETPFAPRGNNETKTRSRISGAQCSADPHGNREEAVPLLRRWRSAGKGLPCYKSEGQWAYVEE